MIACSTCPWDLFLASGIDAKLTKFHPFLFQRTGWISWPTFHSLGIILPRKGCPGICLQKLTAPGSNLALSCQEILPISIICQVLHPDLWDVTNLCAACGVWAHNKYLLSWIESGVQCLLQSDPCPFLHLHFPHLPMGLLVSFLFIYIPQLTAFAHAGSSSWDAYKSVPVVPY